WTDFLDRCLQLRISVDKFTKFANELSKRSHCDGPKLAEALLRPRSKAITSLDPLVPVYLERLLAMNKLSPPDVLGVLYHHSQHGSTELKSSHASSEKKASSWQVTPELEELVCGRIMKAFTANERPRTISEARRTLQILSQWMTTVSNAQTADSLVQSLAEGSHHLQAQTVMNLGMLVLSVVENPKVAGVIEMALPKDFRKTLAQSLTMFNSHLAHASIPLADRLGIFMKQYCLIENLGGEMNDGSGSNTLDVSVLQLEAVMDLPIINTRPGLYIFINSLLMARPLTDDSMILNYLNARYKGDIQSLTVDLVTTSFDVLAGLSTLYPAESNETLFNFRSFLVNKVPTLLTILASSMFPPLTPEICITQALNHIDRNAFPSFSQAFDNMAGGHSMLNDVRQDFLFACALHQLVRESSIERLLGETPMASVPASGKYIKENLVSQCSTNFERVEELLNEIEGMDGNAGAIVGAVTEIIRNLCTTKETMSLKTICNSLSRKPRSLDVMLQYTSPASILQPLCQLLDAWKNEEDQGEYQPVYDEFGAILVLIQAFVHRHDLKPWELGLESNSFVARMFNQGHKDIPLEELSEEQNRDLSGWLKGLYDPDGITDELLSSCRPQDFYLLVPTLFQQTIFAVSEDVISLDTVKSGLEFLLETFLLPSLVGAVTWMTAHALEQSPQELNITIQLLTRLIRPASISGDAQAIHGTILAIVARRLEKCLQTIQHRESRPEINGLLEIVSRYRDYERTPYSSAAEFEPWMSTPGTSIRLVIRNVVQALVMWNSTSGLNPMPPAYTHRQLFLAVQILGTRKVLLALLEELKAQTEAGSGAVALDIITNLVCSPLPINSCMPVEWVNSSAPSTMNPRTRLNLREMLKAELDDPANLVATDMALAEAAVRLHRRVEA
ncbi:mediator of RNA polymeras-like protein II transcription subunit 5, partial [Saccharata proteae CBS 121410]